MKKLVVYITSAFPDREFSIDLALALKDSGVDSLELGVPFSDPVADGPTIEEANLKAIAHGYKIEDTFYISQKIAKEIDTLWMGYFNSFYHKGFELMLQKAKESGVSGFILPDLPCEECNPYMPLYEKYQISPISFVAPTDSKERIKKITERAKKFIYLVAYTGITGSGKSEDLNEILKNIRESTQTPIYLGFGVNKENAKEKANGVDGVIVGSIVVKILLETVSNSEKIKKICELTKEIKAKINGD